MFGEERRKPVWRCGPRGHALEMEVLLSPLLVEEEQQQRTQFWGTRVAFRTAPISSPPHALVESGKSLTLVPPPTGFRTPFTPAQLPKWSCLAETSGSHSIEPTGFSSSSCTHCTSERVDGSTICFVRRVGFSMSCFTVGLHAATSCAPVKIDTATSYAPCVPERVDASLSRALSAFERVDDSTSRACTNHPGEGRCLQHFLFSGKSRHSHGGS